MNNELIARGVCRTALATPVLLIFLGGLCVMCRATKWWVGLYSWSVSLCYHRTITKSFFSVKCIYPGSPSSAQQGSVVGREGVLCAVRRCFVQ